MRKLGDARGKLCEVEVRLDANGRDHVAYEQLWTGGEVALVSRPTEEEAFDAAAEYLRTRGTYQRIV